MSASPTPAERIAMKTAWAALHNATSPNSEMVETIVYGLGSAGLLMDPEAAAEVERLRELVAAMHAAAVGETKTPLLGLVDDVTITRSSFLAQQHRADNLDGIAREMANRVAELEDAAYGDATVRLLNPVEQIQHLHAAVAAQMSRADTLNGIARQLRARVTELEDAAEVALKTATDTTPCSVPNPCEDGGEPCTRHEREESHADGEHELCGPECEARATEAGERS